MPSLQHPRQRFLQKIVFFAKDLELQVTQPDNLKNMKNTFFFPLLLATALLSHASDKPVAFWEPAKSVEAGGKFSLIDTYAGQSLSGQGKLVDDKAVPGGKGLEFDGKEIAPGSSGAGLGRDLTCSPGLSLRIYLKPDFQGPVEQTPFKYGDVELRMYTNNSRLTLLLREKKYSISGNDFPSASLPIKPNEWNLVEVEINGADLVLRINGIEAKSFGNPGTMAGILNGAPRIGGWGNRPFKGQIGPILLANGKLPAKK
jgi:hypothetical protein